MGKLLPDLDLRIARLQGDYQHNYADGDYRVAAHFLFQLNANLTKDCRITDLPQPSSTSEDYFGELCLEEDYRDYCDKYAPIVFNAIAEYNEKMIKLLARQGGY